MPRRPLIIEQLQPSHWAPPGRYHHPRRCVLCLLARLGHRLGLIAVESHTETSSPYFYMNAIHELLTNNGYPPNRLLDFWKEPCWYLPEYATNEQAWRSGAHVELLAALQAAYASQRRTS